MKLSALWPRGLLAALMISPLCTLAHAMEDKLVVVTSFPEDLTSVFQAAFERHHPGTKVEVLNKKT
ncbi:MAG: hypothetical protein WBM63_05405, partial [Sedimenticolaceae bacterium]